MNTVQSEAGVGKRHRLSIIFAVFFALGLGLLKKARSCPGSLSRKGC